MLLNWPKLENSFQDDFGSSFTIHEAIPIDGGDINLAFKIDTNKGQYFVKLNTPEKIDMFESERDGLLELAKCDALLVPEPYSVGQNANAAYLCMSFLDMQIDIDQSLLGRAIAELHHPIGQQFGLSANNFIGTNVQHNQWTENWPAFFWEGRLEPQLYRMLEVNTGFPEEAFEPLQQAVLNILGHKDYVPSLVHGDLWNGNVGLSRDGKPCLFDPAVYWGHSETDLAMAKLFGGFQQDFYDAYESVRAAEEGDEERLQVYQLYHLLNHYNLFGESYLEQCIKQIGKIMAAG